MMRWGVWGLVVAALLGGCSVSTPRNGDTALQAGPSAAGTNGYVDGSGNGAGSDSGPGDGVTASGGSQSSSGGQSATGSDATGRPGGSPGEGGGAEDSSGSAGGGAAGGNATGVTKDTVTVSIVAGFTGPLAPIVEKAYDGMLTWLDDVNEAGGIHGRKVILKKVDHKETVDGGVAACKQVLSNGSLFAAVPEGVDATLSAISCLDAARVPTLYYSGTTDPNWKYAFADIITSAGGGHVMGSYVANFLHGKGKKVGVIYVNQLSYKAAADSFVPEARRLGADVAVVEDVEPNQASFTSELIRMQEAKVEILVISATAEAVGILRDAKSLRFQPVFTGWGFQFDFVTVGARSLFDGVTGLRSYATVDSAAYEKYAARMRARGRGRERTQDLEGINAYGHALVIGELLQRAGPQPTRESLVAGAETFRGFDTGILPPITWGPGNHEGARAAFPVVCCSSDYTWKNAGSAREVF